MNELLKTIAREGIKKDEGFAGKVYQCTAGKLTIGYGTNLEDRGITREEAELMLNNEINTIISQLQDEIFFKNSPIIVQYVLVNMAYQLGIPGFFKFHRTLDYCEKKEWSKMADEMLNSAWAKQTPERANRLANLVRAQAII